MIVSYSVAWSGKYQYRMFYCAHKVNIEEYPAAAE